MSNEDTFGTETGLDYTGVVEEAIFETDNEYRDGEVPRLVLNVRDLNTGTVRVERWGTGPGWETAKGGACVVNLAGKEKFNGNTDMGKLLKSAAKADMIGALAKSGTAQEATIWKGLTLNLMNVTYTFKSQETGEDVEYSRTMLAETQNTGTGTGTAGADDVKEKLNDLWVQVRPDHDKFKEQAFLTVPQVLADPTLEQLVSDVSQWT